MRSRYWHVCVLVLLAAVWSVEAPAVEPADVLGDHMVLQRGKAAPIWGTAKAGEMVTVMFAGQSKSATADKGGRWMVRLDPLEASAKARELTIKGASGTVTLKDVLVGDVWIAGGQSNMGRDVNRSWRPDGQRMDYPQIRFLTVGSRGTKYPSAKLVPPPPPSSPRRAQRVTAPRKWHVCTDRNTPECCAVGFFFAERIYKATGIPQGLLWNAVAGSTVQEWIPRFGWWLRPELAEMARAIDAWYPSTQIGRAAFAGAVEGIDVWREKAERAVRQGEPFPYPQPMLPEPDDGRGRGRGATILYNGRVHPLVPYAIAGILWYQGESDYANRGYLRQIEAMAESWRRRFACPGEKPADLPFYFVQMQRCGSYMSPEIRDHQLESYFTIPNAGMAVLIDIDMNLHPANKYDTGRRMALWALAKHYGKDVIYSGPIYKSHRTDGGKVVVEFTHTHGGLLIGRKNKLDPPQAAPDGKLVNLEITADGRKWVPAQSRIDGERLIVWADGLAKPTDVRYCWKSKADEPFLYNQARLPAAQFNTTTKYGAKPAAPPAAPKRGGRAKRPATRAALTLSASFGESCVLQRDMKVPVWGGAAPGEKVTVTFAGQSKSAAADRFGRWRVELDPMPASAKGRPLVFEGTYNRLEVKPVYVGDVWLYLSQSWHLGGPKELRVDSDSIGPICINVPASVWEHQNHSQRPLMPPADRGRWTVYKAPGKYFRNDGYYFGLGLTRAAKAPVGVMGLGASTLESMTPPEGFQTVEKELGPLAASIAAWIPHTRRGREAYLKTLGQIDQWVQRSRATCRRAGITHEDFTQPPELPGPAAIGRGPTTTYNHVVHRFTPGAIRGIIIQPKTFNVGDPQYAIKAKALILGLRAAFGRKVLPVCFVQMHNPGRYERNETEDQGNWVRMRAAQNQLAQIPHTSVVATYDLKLTSRSEPDLGLRAAQWADAVVRGAPVRTGPIYKGHRVDGRRVIVTFSHVGRGLMAGLPKDGTLGGFRIAGADKQWRDAKAAIEGGTVVVTCEKVARPLAVRYAWAAEPTAANLFNRDGFPALPFAAP